MVPYWIEMQAERLVLELREILARCDENLKADTLLRECVPYFLERDHPLILQARSQQEQMVAHITGEPQLYADYYATNVHERPFEEQYGISPEQAKEPNGGIPRVHVLYEELRKPGILGANGEPPSLLDLSCNDGWMAQSLRGLVRYYGVDLNPDCIERAKARKVPGAAFLCGDLHDVGTSFGGRGGEGYDVVVCFEVIEHVRDPQRTIETIFSLVRPGGRVFISTPCGAVEHGDVPQWWLVEPKGHVRVFTPESFTELLHPHGELEPILLCPDGTMVARMRRPDSRPRDELQAHGADRLGAAGTPAEQAQR